jgi:hypothetical protein
MGSTQHALAVLALLLPLALLATPPASAACVVFDTEGLPGVWVDVDGCVAGTMCMAEHPLDDPGCFGP